METRRAALISALAGAAVAALGLQKAAVAQQKTLREQLIGTWMLVSNYNVSPNGEKRQLFGLNPKGITIYDSSGWYVQMQINPDRPKFKGATRLDGTEEENRSLVQGTAGHFGTWAADEAAKTLTVHMEANIFPNDDGSVFTRKISIVGDDMTVSNPNPSAGGSSVIVWRRVK